MEEQTARYRSFEFTRMTIDENNVIRSFRQMINLADVKSYYEFSFYNNVDSETKKVCLEYYSGDAHVAKMSYEKFKDIHTQFLVEYGDIDPRSLKKKVIDRNLPLEVARFHGDILTEFHALQPIKTIFHNPGAENMRVTIYESNNGEEPSPHLGDGVIYFN